MNSPVRTPNAHRDKPTQPEWRRVETWRQLIAACGRKPSRKRVHGLRVATLRLQAEMENWLRAQGPQDPVARKVKRWNKQADKLRDALGPVREADVFLVKLDRLRGMVTGPDQGQTRLSRICLRQISSLEDWFAQRRKTAAKDLTTEIADRRERLTETSKEVEIVLENAGLEATGSGLSEVREMIAGLATEFPELNGASLHEFRKRIKMLRYLAEPIAAGDPRTGRQVAALRRMQSAAGEWHDLQALSKKASKAFRGRHKASGLAELLNTLAEESLEKALEVCRRTMPRLQIESTGEDVAQQLPPRKLPVRSIEPLAAAEKRRSA
jgi:CHAD domain-containing protein